MQEWSTAIDSSKLVGVVFLDLKKAFDRVCLPGLLYKLKAVGVRGKALAWFASFLLGRKQRTAVGRSLSPIADLHAGVPQGAILSPLLFSLYMNDIVEATGADINLFADDTSVCVTDSSPCRLQQKMQHAVEKLAAWFSSWALSINNKKSALMVFTSRKSVPSVAVSINGEPIRHVLNHKHLGLVFDSHLSWSAHATALVNKVWVWFLTLTCHGQPILLH